MSPCWEEEALPPKALLAGCAEAGVSDGGATSTEVGTWILMPLAIGSLRGEIGVGGTGRDGGNSFASAGSEMMPAGGSLPANICG